MTMEVEIPPNSSATLYIPGDPVHIEINGEILEGSDFEYLPSEGGMAVKTGSGRYRIVTQSAGD